MTTAPNPSWAFNADHCYEWAYWDSLFSPEECQSIITLGNSKNFSDGVIRNNENNKNVRNSQVCWLTPTKDATWIYERLTNAVISLNTDYFKFDISGFNEGLQLTKYEYPDGKYDSHVDVRFKSVIRKLTIVVQLTDPSKYEGGNLELIFSDEPSAMDKSIGRLVAFPSYVLHRVTPVTCGTRYSLVGWVTGRPFK